MLDGNRIAMQQKRGAAMSALLRPDIRLPQRRNFLNEHRASLRKISVTNARRKDDEKENHILAQRLKVSLFQQTPSRYRAISSVRKSPRVLEDLNISEPALHKDFGVVPAYLRKFHEEESHRASAERKAREAALIPAGCRLMTSDEQSRTVLDLESRKRDLLDDLKHFPITSCTLKQRRRKLEAELKLDEIERLLEKFRRGKVLMREDGCEVR